MNSTRKMVINGLGITLVLLATAFININLGISLVNMGDAFIFTLAIFYGPSTGLICGAIGSFLADWMVFPTTMFFTLFVKGIEGLVVGILANLIKKSVKKERIKFLFYALSMLCGGLLMVGGYFFSNAVIYGNFKTPLAAVPYDLIQAGVNLIVGILLCCLLAKSANKINATV